MLIHVFNSAVVSGPEVLAIPALKNLSEPVELVFLAETRLGDRHLGPVNYAKSFGYSTHVIEVRSRWDKQAFRDLNQLFRRLKPTVIHAHDVKASLYVWRASKLGFDFKTSLVSTHHGAAARKGKIRIYEEIYVRWVLPHFDRVLAVCSSDIASLERRGLSRKKLVVHLNGVDRPKVPPAERKSAQARFRASWENDQLKLSDTPTVLGVIARLSPEKRFDRILEAVSYAAKKRPDLKWKLLCFGMGDEEIRLKELTKTLQLEDRVKWMGYRGTIGAETAGFDLILALSDGEGIPINMLEAGWAGTPVLSTRVGGIPDIIEDARTGYLVEKSLSNEAIGERILSAIENPEERNRLGANFQKEVETRFSQKAWIGALEKVYAELR